MGPSGFPSTTILLLRFCDWHLLPCPLISGEKQVPVSFTLTPHLLSCSVACSSTGSGAEAWTLVWECWEAASPLRDGHSGPDTIPWPLSTLSLWSLLAWFLTVMSFVLVRQNQRGWGLTRVSTILNFQVPQTELRTSCLSLSNILLKQKNG